MLDDVEQPRAVERVRAELTALAAEDSSAPQVPPEVTAKVVTALRAAPSPAVVHRVTGFTGRDHRVREPLAQIGAVAGVVAAIVGIVLGTAMLIRTPAPTPDTGPTAQHITVPVPTIPRSEPQIAGLLHRPPDYGPLTDPERRASCLSGLGYPISVPILGAEPVRAGDRPAVLLVMGGDKPAELVALLVPSNCSSVDTGLIADTTIRRP